MRKGMSSPRRHQVVKIYVAMKRKLSVGGHMAGRTEQGVIAKIRPIEDMPYMPMGRPSTSFSILWAFLPYERRADSRHIWAGPRERWGCTSLPPFSTEPTMGRQGSFPRHLRPPERSSFDCKTGERFEQQVTVGSST